MIKHEHDVACVRFVRPTTNLMEPQSLGSCIMLLNKGQTLFCVLGVNQTGDFILWICRSEVLMSCNLP